MSEEAGRKRWAGEKTDQTYETRRSLSQFESVCASSLGGPGLNRGEHRAGRSILGTADHGISSLPSRSVQGRPCHSNEEWERADPPRNPSSGFTISGSATSALIPHTIVVSPILTNAEPSAVEIDPAFPSALGPFSTCPFTAEHKVES